MILMKRYRLPRYSLWKSMVVSIAVCGLLILSDQLSMHLGLDGSQRIADDFLGGLITGSVFHLYQSHKLRRLNAHYRIIELMNHHVRNALQPVLFITYELKQEQHRKIVEESVRRIEWALREVLPGTSEEEFYPAGAWVEKDSEDHETVA